MTRPQLAFDFTKRVRRRDPETSRAAAARAGEFGSDHHAKIVGSLLTQARPTQNMRASPSGRACRVWEAC